MNAPLFPLETRQISYVSGYKHKTTKPAYFHTGIIPRVPGGNAFVQLSETGLLTIAAEYAWNGPSGPSIPTDSFIRASLPHDALYQLIKEGWLTDADREAADRLLIRLADEDGMMWIRQQWVYHGVRTFGGLYAHKAEEVKLAPKFI